MRCRPQNRKQCVKGDAPPPPAKDHRAPPFSADQLFNRRCFEDVLDARSAGPTDLQSTFHAKFARMCYIKFCSIDKILSFLSDGWAGIEIGCKCNSLHHTSTLGPFSDVSTPPRFPFFPEDVDVNATDSVSDTVFFLFLAFSENSIFSRTSLVAVAHIAC